MKRIPRYSTATGGSTPHSKHRGDESDGERGRVEDKGERRTSERLDKLNSKTERRRVHISDDDDDVEDDSDRDASRPITGKDRQEEEEPDERDNVIVGTAVEVCQQDKWIPGKVVEINGVKGTWRIKLDQYPQDKHDKWFSEHSTQVRLVSKRKKSSTITGHTSPTSSRSQGVGGSKLESARSQSTRTVSTETSGLPSSSGAGTVAMEMGGHDSEAPTSSSGGGVASSSSLTNSNIVAVCEEIAAGYRTCLRYFLPPQWIMDKDAVSVLSIHELSGFPLDDFFDQYEKGLRKLVSTFQVEAQVKQTDADVATNKLSSVRKMIAKLLKTINEEFDIDPECDSDQVDELLALCLKQALTHVKRGTTTTGSSSV